MEFAPSLDMIISETLPALQKVKDSGKAKFIGITGYPLENFKYEILYPCICISFSILGILFLRHTYILKKFDNSSGKTIRNLGFLWEYLYHS